MLKTSTGQRNDHMKDAWSFSSTGAPCCSVVRHGRLEALLRTAQHAALHAANPANCPFHRLHRIN
jgi:hypothetical protein